MGLLSKASTLDSKKKGGLAFSDFINKHSLKKCALLEKNAAGYVITNSIGFDALSVISSKSTNDFWMGICKDEGKIYSFSASEINPLLQLFSNNLKDSVRELFIYKSKSSNILLSFDKLSEACVKDFELTDNSQHIINYLSLNPLLNKASVFLLYSIDFEEALTSFYKSNCKNDSFDYNLFLNALKNEIYNRFACFYNNSDTSIISNPHCIKTVIVTDKEYSVDLITNHLILNLREVLEDSSQLLQIDYCGKADSCEKIKTFLQAE